MRDRVRFQMLDQKHQQLQTNRSHSFGEFRDFLRRYRGFNQSISEKIVEQFRLSFERTRSGLDAIRVKLSEAGHLLAPDFNIFYVLNLQHSEKMHSDFLAELLLPKGRHGQGEVFLKRFLEHLEKTEPRSRPVSPALSAASRVWVRRERKILDGRIDIVVEVIKPSIVLVIENKIGAPDQEDQVNRYRRWLDKQPQLNKFLVYLTKEGLRSTSAKPEEKYTPMSYVSDVNKWLQSCLPELAAPKIVQLVNQYLELLSTF